MYRIEFRRVVLSRVKKNIQREIEEESCNDAKDAIVIKTEAKCFDIYRLALWLVVPRMAVE